MKFGAKLPRSTEMIAPDQGNTPHEANSLAVKRAGVLPMIGDFRFSAAPSQEVVRIELYWSGKNRFAKVILPIEVERAVRDEALPSAEDLGIGPALAYGIVMATTSQRQMLITGDRSAWPDAWGQLMDAKSH